jgi:hypothetical protein
MFLRDCDNHPQAAPADTQCDVHFLRRLQACRDQCHSSELCFPEIVRWVLGFNKPMFVATNYPQVGETGLNPTGSGIAGVSGIQYACRLEYEADRLTQPQLIVNGTFA